MPAPAAAPATSADPRTTTRALNGTRKNGTAAGSAEGALHEALQEFPYDFAVVSVESMMVDKRYQRELTRFVDEITENYNPLLIQVLALSERKPGKPDDHGIITGGQYAIMDGQTRWEASKENDRHSLPALVYSGLNRQDEANIFELLATERRNVSGLARFKAALEGKRPEALAISRLVKSVGLDIGKGPGEIAAISALEYGYRLDNFALERGLMTLKMAFPDDKLDNRSIRAMVYFLRRHPDIDDELLVRRLKAVGIKELRLRASHMSASGAKVEGRGTIGFLAETFKNTYRS